MDVVRVYLDLPLAGALLAWIQDTALLWMIGQIGSMQSGFVRYVGGGFIGALFQFGLLLYQASGGQVAGWIMTPIIFILIIPCLMIGIAFFPFHGGKFFKAIGYFYLLAFLLAGIQWGLDSLNQRFLHWEISWWGRFCLHLTILFSLGELGWGVVHRRLWEQTCLFPIEIAWDEHQLRVNALLDTGNRLHDPLTRVPVIVVELDQIRPLLPKEVLAITSDVLQGKMETEWKLPKEWEQRLRLLPFHSLGKEHGLLVGFRPDRIRVWQKEKEFVNCNVVVGLYNKTLSRDGMFQALIPPGALQE